MGMFDYVVCKYPLPVEGAPENDWQTKDTPDQMMSTYTITEDGRLLHDVWHHEDVPERERPNWGKPAWDSPFGPLIGCARRVVDMAAVPLLLTGSLEFHTMCGAEWWSFTALFEKGQLLNIVGGKEEDDAPPEQLAPVIDEGETHG